MQVLFFLVFSICKTHANGFRWFFLLQVHSDDCICSLQFVWLGQCKIVHDVGFSKHAIRRHEHSMHPPKNMPACNFHACAQDI